MLTLDHAKLVGRQPREMKRFRKYLLEIVPGVPPPALQVLHQPDYSCCHAERWNQTMAEIVLAVKTPARLLAWNLRYDKDMP